MNCVHIRARSRSSRPADKRSPSLAIDGRHIRLAQPRRRLDQRIEHRLQIEGRAADDLEHVGGGGLLLQRFAQLVEQPGVLDRDDGLRGEILDQLDLLVGERPDLLAIDDDRADQLVVLEHRHRDERTRPPVRAAMASRGFDSIVGGVDRSLCAFMTRRKRRSARPVETDRARCRPRRMRAAHHARRRGIAPSNAQNAELGLADARRLLQHGLEHRLQLARRA